MYCYDDRINRAVHVALVKGDLSTTDNPLVRVHLQDTLGDVIGVHEPVARLASGECNRAYRRRKTSA